MSKLEEAEKFVADLSPAERAELLQSMVRDLGEAYPGIESKPNVCGGEACIVRTRIPVWILEQARRLGTSESELLGPITLASSFARSIASLSIKPRELTT